MASAHAHTPEPESEAASPLVGEMVLVAIPAAVYRALSDVAALRGQTAIQALGLALEQLLQDTRKVR